MVVQVISYPSPDKSFYVKQAYGLPNITGWFQVGAEFCELCKYNPCPLLSTKSKFPARLYFTQ